MEASHTEFTPPVHPDDFIETRYAGESRW
jgi:hypothetical protein